MDTANGNLVHLNTKQANTFIDYVADESVVIKNSRIKKMNSPMETIAKIGVGDEIFHPAQRGKKLAEDKRIEASWDTIKLATKEIIAEVKILDDELEDNIEGMSFKEHLMRMISKKWANQLERAALYSKKKDNPQTIHDLFDGFLTRVEKKWNVVDANIAGFSDRFIDKNKLAKLYKSIPTKYRTGLNKFYMPNDLAIDFETLYEQNKNDVTKKWAFGIGFNNVPLMNTERPVIKLNGFKAELSASATTWNKTIVLTSVDGLTVGKDITLAYKTNKEFTSVVENINVSSKTVTLEEALPDDYSNTNPEEKKVFEVILDWADVILTEKSNFIWGIQRDITIETERSARERATYFVLTMRCDFQVENPEAIGLLTNVKVK